MELFRAYTERRNADKQENDSHLFELIKEIEGGTTLDRFAAVANELVMLNILNELDPVIADLLKFCNNSGPGSEQLVNLRSALRIGKGHAPSDSAAEMLKREVQAQWIAAYNEMEAEVVHISENCIADKVAKATGVSRATAISHWRALKSIAPSQARWALQIANRARISDAHRRIVARPLRPKPTAKLKRLTFGKGV